MTARDYINQRIISINAEAYYQELAEVDENSFTLETIFEDEALAMCVRDQLGKFSISQPVSQEELDTITSIQVFSSGDYGTFTSLRGIGYLRNLQVLGLYNGCCSGIKELPDDFFTLSVLHTVTLSGSSITSIPEELGFLTRLQRLDIDRTGITTLPNSIGELINLYSLNVSSTGINTLPASIANCTSLKSLDISYTAITKLPESVYTLTLDSLKMQGLSIK